MRRRARRHGPKGPPSSIHLAYLSRVRLPPARHSSSPSPRKPRPRSNVPPDRRGSPSLPFPRSTAPSRARWILEMEAKENRSEEHTSELQSRFDLVCRLLLEKKKKGK